jgi:hypothetical protein
MDAYNFKSSPKYRMSSAVILNFAQPVLENAGIFKYKITRFFIIEQTTNKRNASSVLLMSNKLMVIKL